MKQPLLSCILFLSACSSRDPYLLPDNQSHRFNCDTIPYRPDCAKRSDYDRHLEMIRKEKETRRLIRK